MFSLRIVNVDSFQSVPTKGYDICYSEFRGCEIFKVPIIRIFGITPAGQKGCLHVHGVFPYFSIRCKDVFPNIEAKSLRKCMQELALDIDKALNVASRNSNSHRQHVYKIVVTEQIPFYGFHEKTEEFLKIYFYNPFDISRTAELMTNGVILNKFIQPYEAHIPYILQFFIDYNLFGMNLINVSKFQFRASESGFISPVSPLRNQSTSHILDESISSSKKVWNIGSLSSSQISGLPRQTVCELELDCCSSEIMNRLNESFSSGKNPGLLAIWEEEIQRRKSENDTSQITPVPSQERTTDFFETESENFYKKKLRKILETFDMYKVGSKEKFDSFLKDSKDHLPSSNASDLSTTQDEEMLNMMLSMVNNQSAQLDDDSILGLNHENDLQSESVDEETVEMSQVFTGELEEQIWSSQQIKHEPYNNRTNSNIANSASSNISEQSVMLNENQAIPQLDGAFDQDFEPSHKQTRKTKAQAERRTLTEYEESLIKSCSLKTPVIQLIPSVIIKREVPSPAEIKPVHENNSAFASEDLSNSSHRNSLSLCVPISKNARCSLIMNIFENSNDVSIEHTCDNRINHDSSLEAEDPSNVVFEVITNLIYKVECLTEAKKSCYEHLTEEYDGGSCSNSIVEGLSKEDKNMLSKLKVAASTYCDKHLSSKKIISNESRFSLPLKKRIYNWDKEQLTQCKSCSHSVPLDFSKIGKEVVLVRKLSESDFVNNVKLDALKVVIPHLSLPPSIFSNTVLTDDRNSKPTSSNIGNAEKDSKLSSKKMMQLKNTNYDSVFSNSVLTEDKDLKPTSNIDNTKKDSKLSNKKILQLKNNNCDTVFSNTVFTEDKNPKPTASNIDNSKRYSKLSSKKMMQSKNTNCDTGVFSNCVLTEDKNSLSTSNIDNTKKESKMSSKKLLQSKSTYSNTVLTEGTIPKSTTSNIDNAKKDSKLSKKMMQSKNTNCDTGIFINHIFTEDKNPMSTSNINNTKKVSKLSNKKILQLKNNCDTVFSITVKEDKNPKPTTSNIDNSKSDSKLSSKKMMQSKNTKCDTGVFSNCVLTEDKNSLSTSNIDNAKKESKMSSKKLLQSKSTNSNTVLTEGTIPKSTASNIDNAKKDPKLSSKEMVQSKSTNCDTVFTEDKNLKTKTLNIDNAKKDSKLIRKKMMQSKNPNCDVGVFSNIVFTEDKNSKPTSNIDNTKKESKMSSKKLLQSKSTNSNIALTEETIPKSTASNIDNAKKDLKLSSKKMVESKNTNCDAGVFSNIVFTEDKNSKPTSNIDNTKKESKMSSKKLLQSKSTNSNTVLTEEIIPKSTASNIDNAEKDPKFSSKKMVESKSTNCDTSVFSNTVFTEDKNSKPTSNIDNTKMSSKKLLQAKSANSNTVLTEETIPKSTASNIDNAEKDPKFSSKKMVESKSTNCDTSVFSNSIFTEDKNSKPTSNIDNTKKESKMSSKKLLQSKSTNSNNVLTEETIPKSTTTNIDNTKKDPKLSSKKMVQSKSTNCDTGVFSNSVLMEDKNPKCASNIGNTKKDSKLSTKKIIQSKNTNCDAVCSNTILTEDKNSKKSQSNIDNVKKDSKMSKKKMLQLKNTTYETNAPEDKGMNVFDDKKDNSRSDSVDLSSSNDHDSNKHIKDFNTLSSLSSVRKSTENNISKENNLDSMNKRIVNSTESQAAKSKINSTENKKDIPMSELRLFRRKKSIDYNSNEISMEESIKDPHFDTKTIDFFPDGITIKKEIEEDHQGSHITNFNIKSVNTACKSSSSICVPVVQLEQCNDLIDKYCRNENTDSDCMILGEYSHKSRTISNNMRRKRLSRSRSKLVKDPILDFRSGVNNKLSAIDSKYQSLNYSLKEEDVSDVSDSEVQIISTPVLRKRSANFEEPNKKKVRISKSKQKFSQSKSQSLNQKNKQKSCDQPNSSYLYADNSYNVCYEKSVPQYDFNNKLDNSMHKNASCKLSLKLNRKSKSPQNNYILKNEATVNSDVIDIDSSNTSSSFTWSTNPVQPKTENLFLSKKLKQYVSKGKNMKNYTYDNMNAEAASDISADWSIDDIPISQLKSSQTLKCTISKKSPNGIKNLHICTNKKPPVVPKFKMRKKKKSLNVSIKVRKSSDSQSSDPDFNPYDNDSKHKSNSKNSKKSSQACASAHGIKEKYKKKYLDKKVLDSNTALESKDNFLNPIPLKSYAAEITRLKQKLKSYKPSPQSISSYTSSYSPKDGKSDLSNLSPFTEDNSSDCKQTKTSLKMKLKLKRILTRSNEERIVVVGKELEGANVSDESISEEQLPEENCIVKSNSKPEKDLSKDALNFKKSLGSRNFKYQQNGLKAKFKCPVLDNKKKDKFEKYKQKNGIGNNIIIRGEIPKLRYKPLLATISKDLLSDDICNSQNALLNDTSPPKSVHNTIISPKKKSPLKNAECVKKELADLTEMMCTTSYSVKTNLVSNPVLHSENSMSSYENAETLNIKDSKTNLPNRSNLSLTICRLQERKPWTDPKIPPQKSSILNAEDDEANLISERCESVTISRRRERKPSASSKIPSQQSELLHPETDHRDSLLDTSYLHSRLGEKNSSKRSKILPRRSSLSNPEVAYTDSLLDTSNSFSRLEERNSSKRTKILSRRSSLLNPGVDYTHSLHDTCSRLRERKTSTASKIPSQRNSISYTKDDQIDLLPVTDTITISRLRERKPSADSKMCSRRRSLLNPEDDETDLLSVTNSSLLTDTKLRERKPSTSSKIPSRRGSLLNPEFDNTHSLPDTNLNSRLEEKKPSTEPKIPLRRSSILNPEADQTDLLPITSNLSITISTLREEMPSTDSKISSQKNSLLNPENDQTDTSPDSSNLSLTLINCRLRDRKPSTDSKIPSRRNSLRSQDFKKYFTSDNEEDSNSLDKADSSIKLQNFVCDLPLSCKPCTVKVQKLSSLEIEQYLYRPIFKPQNTEIIMSCEPSVLSVPSPIVDSKGIDSYIDQKMLDNLFNFPLACNSPLKYNKFEASPLTIENDKSLDTFSNDNSEHSKKVMLKTNDNSENCKKRPSDVFKSIERDDMGVLWNLAYLSPMSVDLPPGSPPSCLSPTQNSTEDLSEKYPNYEELDDLQKLASKANRLCLESRNSHMLKKVCSAALVKDVTYNLLESESENSSSVMNEGITSTDSKSNKSCIKESKISFQNILEENESSSFNHKSAESEEPPTSNSSYDFDFASVEDEVAKVIKGETNIEDPVFEPMESLPNVRILDFQECLIESDSEMNPLLNDSEIDSVMSSADMILSNSIDIDNYEHCMQTDMSFDNSSLRLQTKTKYTSEDPKNIDIDDIFVKDSIDCTFQKQFDADLTCNNAIITAADTSSLHIPSFKNNTIPVLAINPCEDKSAEFSAFEEQNFNPNGQFFPVMLAPVPLADDVEYLPNSAKEGTSGTQECVDFLEDNELLQSCSVSSTSDIENKNALASNVLGIPFNGEDDILSMIVKSCDIGEEFEINGNAVDETDNEDLTCVTLSNNFVAANYVMTGPDFIINSQSDKINSFYTNSENAVSSSSENNLLKKNSEIVVIKAEPVDATEEPVELPNKNFSPANKNFKSEVLTSDDNVLLDSMIHSFYGEDSLYGLNSSVSCDNISSLCPTFQGSLLAQDMEKLAAEYSSGSSRPSKTDDSTLQASSLKTDVYSKTISEFPSKIFDKVSFQLRTVGSEDKVPLETPKPLFLALPFSKMSSKRYHFAPRLKPPTREIIEISVVKTETDQGNALIDVTEDSLSSDSSINSQTYTNNIPKPNVFNKASSLNESLDSQKLYGSVKTSHHESKLLNNTPILYKDGNCSKVAVSDNLISTPSTSNVRKGFTLPDIVSPINKETALICDTKTRKRKLLFEEDSRGSQKVFKPEREKMLTVFNKFRGNNSANQSLESVGDLSFSQIDGPTLENSRGFKVGSDNYGDACVRHEVQHLTVMSLEIHVNNRNELRPDPKFDSVTAIFYCIYNDIRINEEKEIIGMIIVDPSSHHQTGQNSSEVLRNYLLLCPGVKNGFIYCVENEISLYDKLISIIREWDPDILVGYEIQMSSWGYLVERAEILNINLRLLMSRLVNKNDGKIVQVEQDPTVTDQTADLSKLNITGRIVLCVWRLMRKEVTLNVYTFENVYYHVLHKRTPSFAFSVLTNWFLGSQKEKLIRYYVIRVQGSIHLLEKLDVIGRTSELARLFGIQFYEVLSRGSQFRVESMMLRTAAPMSYIPVSPSVTQRSHSRAAECVPLILEPESRFYVDPVVVLDFQSLYPSMIIAYNYCFSTCLGRVEHFGKNVPFEFGCTSLCVPVSSLQKLQNDIHISPTGIAFVRSSVRRGILPSMLEEILNTRVMVKQSMKKIKDNGALKKLLDARQLGLKLIANVTYGYTGASFSGRMPNVEVADSIVGKARETLERAIHLIENTSKWRAKVVYGDTDSLFILLPGRSKKQAFEIGQEIADAVTADNPKPVKLKFEKVYLPCVLQTKKRYVGYMFETINQEKPVFDAKGIETVRRDSCSATSKVLEKSLKILFDTFDVSLVRNYVQKQFSKLLSGRASIIDCIFAKEYRGISGYRPGACVPALEIAKKRLAKDPRSEPRVGERVPYVVVYGFPGLPIIQLVREPIDLLRDTNIRINASYYITRVVSPPLDRVFTLVNADVKSWYTNLARTFKPTLPLARTVNQQRGTLSQYFTSLCCPSCEKPTFSAVCDDCREDLQGTTVALNEKIRKWERTVDHVAQICGSCTKSGGSIDHCISIDCPMLFKLNAARKDLSQAPYLRKVLAHELF